MHETSNAFLHFDPPGSPDVAVLQGWLVPKPGKHYADVRVVTPLGVLPGIHGIPRRDLAEFFKSDQPHLLAGFDVTLTLPPGRHTLALEGLAIDGTWEPLGSIERDVPAVPVAPNDPVNDTVRGEALAVLLRRVGENPATLDAAAAQLVREIPSRHHLRHPPRPFHGHLDQPHLLARAVFGRLAVSGWVFHENQPIRRILATTDLQAVQAMRLGRATDFLGERSHGSALATHCGYDGFVDLPAQFSMPVSVRIYAELADGSWHLGSVARFTATDDEFAKRSVAPFSRLTFWRAWRALDRELAVAGHHTDGGQVLGPAFRRAWRAFAAAAPRENHAGVLPAPAQVSAASTSAVHLITHNLSHEGAPLFLLEYARQLHASGLPLAVTSAREGPLRGEFESLGATVRVVDAAPLMAASNGAALDREMRALAGGMDLPNAALVVANTLSAWWGVHLAHRAGRPALFYVHESTPPRCFFRALPAESPVLAAVEESFRLADRVSFLTAATQRYYAGLSGGANFCLHPGWIDLGAIDRFRASHPRAGLRAKLNLAPDQRLVLNVGTICERKGQHVFARAVDLLWRTDPDLAKSAVFLMIGGRDTPYDRELASFLTELNRPNLRIVPETGEVYPYYGAADLFACSSYEESFPRVILEAMAFGVPIASSGVHGIPEMTRADREALLVAPGDSAALADGLRRLLASPTESRALAEAARSRVAAEFDSRVVLPRHLALTRALLSG